MKKGKIQVLLTSLRNQIIERYSSFIDVLSRVESLLSSFAQVITFFTLLGIIFHYGFSLSPAVKKINDNFLFFFLWVFILFHSIRILLDFLYARKRRRFWFLILLGFISFFLFHPSVMNLSDPELQKFFHLMLPLLIFAFGEISLFVVNILSLKLNPALIYVSSFLILIGIGTLLLLLPGATTKPISFIDALFTATSATCVTGLVVLDTAQDFTFFGQLIILLLIQIGGLGVVTFTYLFGYFLQGSVSLQSSLQVKEMLSTENLSSTLSIVLRIVLTTLVIELIGALIIASLIENRLDLPPLQRWWFAIFHSISAFCNAGFSTFSQGFYDPALRTFYPLQIVIIIEIILGGIGFYALFSLISFFRYHIVRIINLFFRRKPHIHIPNLINLNARLSFNMTLYLILGGFLAFFLVELWDKHEVTNFTDSIMRALFAAVTPRTAGFNTIDYATLSAPAIGLTLFFMWIGASPASTGGGIKTTTLAVALFNTFSILRNEDRIDYRYRQIDPQTTRRAFAVIITSLLFIGINIFLLSLTEGGFTFQQLAFEVVSATSTVGLTMGVTSKLSIQGKFIITLCMFVGRVSLLNVLSAVIRPLPPKHFYYPKEKVLVG